MELEKYRKFQKEGNYVHCSICRNFENINSFSHRKAKNHQKKLAIQLGRIAFHLSQKKQIQIVVHDEQWEERETKRFCHFCCQSYSQHCMEGEFVIEHLGSLYHHADSHHAESVKAFLIRNFSEEKIEKYCIQKADLDSFLGKLPEAKEKYLKKMDILNDMVVEQIKSTEENRKKFIADTLQETFQEQNCMQDTSRKESIQKSQSMLNIKKNEDVIEVPPWLEAVSNNSTVDKTSSAPVIGPTMDTLIKHVITQKRKGIPKNRIGRNFIRCIQRSSRWLPSYQRTWKKSCRKHSQIQFNRKNKT